ncbi:hypothetical protein [Blastococcus sp. VKM Ac-2987]|uniref:hypothetical protein n=1 Tax=Blastococcus sp. VKM Ac-2987 TaxID=3004141 RepID=UPI0022ABC466|nr:hypothetical protein [Blastococcus sp. VKM Ac-2987]MCZ2857815.1 hypothetical protein [Blastococcus sp. VKM Ac-2987]
MANPPTVPRPRRALGFILAHPWWTGISALVAIAALALSVVTANGDDDDSDTNKNSGDCNAQGSDNSVNCTFDSQPESSANISFTVDPQFGTWFFNGQSSELPSPPQYPPSDVLYHCPDWVDWLAETPQIYAIGGAAYLTMVSGVEDQVTLTDVAVQVYNRQEVPDSNYALIQCNHGADAGAGLLIEVETATGATTVQEIGAATEPMPMPPAVAKLNGLDVEVANISIKSDHYLYQASIIVEALINGEPETLTLGTPEAPYRWVGGDVNLVLGSDVPWDWNINEEEWVEVLNSDDVLAPGD